MINQSTPQETGSQTLLIIAVILLSIVVTTPSLFLAIKLCHWEVPETYLFPLHFGIRVGGQSAAPTVISDLQKRGITELFKMPLHIYFSQSWWKKSFLNCPRVGEQVLNDKSNLFSYHNFPKTLYIFPYHIQSQFWRFNFIQAPFGPCFYKSTK